MKMNLTEITDTLASAVCVPYDGTDLNNIPNIHFSIKEFFELKDFNLQKWIMMNGLVDKTSCYITKVNTEEKIGFYNFTESINYGKTCFYRNKSLNEWIVYDKKTKKAKVKFRKDMSKRLSTSSEKYDIKVSFAKTFFSDIELVRDFIPASFSATFCKKVIEGKIKTVEDLLKYQRSYIYRNKNIPIQLLLEFKLYAIDDRIKFIENFQLFEEESMVEILSELDKAKMSSIGWKIRKKEDLAKNYLNNEYDNWVTTQYRKYDEIRRGRNDKNGINHAVF